MPEEVKAETEGSTNQTQSNSDVALTTARRLRRDHEREAWSAWWKIQDIETRNTWFPRLRYYVWRGFDYPVTWFREKVAEPLQDKNRVPYYHRRISRVPEIDECAVNDLSCIYEANEQYRLDKQVDYHILNVLRDRYNRCMEYHKPDATPCVKTIEDFEESELNFFIKYGELGVESDVKSAYMKQKHRMIWERRHPEIMQERQRLYEEHKRRLAEGDFDMSFWKKGLFYQDKKNYEPPYEFFKSKSGLEGDKPLSKDWQYYKKLKEDPDFDPEQGKTASFKFWPSFFP
uniref:NADH dehydrogenase [ubiquinone] 1 beta subcomplex subunit 10 n=1 Tax=Plectus sambesii TaxID=2011161 RepID=A0A914X397_9BILA